MSTPGTGHMRVDRAAGEVSTSYRGLCKAEIPVETLRTGVTSGQPPVRCVPPAPPPDTGAVPLALAVVCVEDAFLTTTG